MSKQTKNPKMPNGFTDKEPKHLRKGQLPEKMCLIEYAPGKFMKAFRKPKTTSNQFNRAAGNPTPMRLILKEEPYAPGIF